MGCVLIFRERVSFVMYQMRSIGGLAMSRGHCGGASRHDVTALRLLVVLFFSGFGERFYLCMEWLGMTQAELAA